MAAASEDARMKNLTPHPHTHTLSWPRPLGFVSQVPDGTQTGEWPLTSSGDMAHGSYG